jgi:hypothetical protein
MSKQWEELAQRSDGRYVEEDFELAAYRLVAEQVLYYADLQSRKAFWIIKDFKREFEKVLDPLGIDIEINTLLNYICARPRHAKAGSATTNQTLLALVLRSIYDQAMQVGEMANDESEVACELVELEQKYQLATGRDLPGKMELNSLFRQLKRWGLVRIPSDSDMEDSEAESVILIRPAIVEVLGDTALQKLTRWAKGGDSDNEGGESVGVDSEGAEDETA